MVRLSPSVEPSKGTCKSLRLSISPKNPWSSLLKVADYRISVVHFLFTLLLGDEERLSLDLTFLAFLFSLRFSRYSLESWHISIIEIAMTNTTAPKIASIAQDIVC